MKKNKRILGIGIPSYNGEKYLDRCIPTFIHKDIMEKIEVIIVNDGSTDNTKKIAEKYQKMYPDTVFVINKENGGHGSAVNAALEFTSAKYYKVVDCDDWVDTSKLVKLVNFLENNDVDIVTNTYETVDMVTGYSNRIANDGYEYGKIYNFSELHVKNLYLSIHSTTYKTDILKKNNIKLQENTFFVDVEYQLLPTPYIKTIAFLNDIVYKYMIGNVNQSVNIDNFVKRYDHHDRVVKRIIEFLKKAKLSENQYLYVESVFLQVLNTHYNLSSYYDSDEDRGRKRSIEFDKYLLKNNKLLYEKLGAQYKNIYKLRKYNFDRKKAEKQSFETLRKIKRVLFN